MTAPCTVEISGSRATIMLNKPDKHNALEVEDLNKIREHIATLKQRSELRILILTGAGEKSFCAGVSLGDIGGTDWSQNPLALLCDQIEALPFPTLCACNGSVYGGGSDLALACDFRIGVRGMRAFVPPARLGIHYHLSGLRRAVERLGLSASKRLFLAAETFDDQELLRLQFVDRLCDRADFKAIVDRFADELCALAPLALRGMKMALNQIAQGTIDNAAIDANIKACWASEDFREGQAASVEKRAPLFKGR